MGTPGRSTVLRVVFGVVTVGLAGALVLTQLTTVDASSCTTSAKATSEGARPQIPAGAPVYLEVMSGDVELNRKLRAGLEAELAGHEIVERAARQAPRGAAGLKLIVTMWAPKWFPFKASGNTTLEAELRVGQQKVALKGTLDSACTGLVNKDKFHAAEQQRMLDWTTKVLAL